MASRRDILLQQMGITQWVLGRPAVLQGEVAISVPAHVRLLIVSAQPVSADDVMVGDVLSALRLERAAAMLLTPEQYAMLPPEAAHDAWLLGEEITPGAGKGILQTPALQALYDNPGAKRALWRQICHDEHYFFADAG
ncbi:DNA polymerase III subunit psi [Enterobacillus tribolii]|uniref:DNA polymerase III subunit psi n=1 Tax=Enterobacillus tribolii TaxID=1487935 RepID=A0A370QQE9_9GAMM|nr:DNA polymerase III subunit psi [Enterobacillus tribolii]MBW7981558.1 DNA polymerase III subunit psi [Enterobacillus tribolii]RDK90935.1 DNA polymerase III psi subunit [Enterobacillus tribolii]